MRAEDEVQHTINMATEGNHILLLLRLFAYTRCLTLAVLFKGTMLHFYLSMLGMWEEEDGVAIIKA